MDLYQIILWAFIGLIFAGYGYLTNKIGDWSVDFQMIRFVITVVMGALVGTILAYMGIEITPDSLVFYLEMPLFAGLGILYVVERLVKVILELVNTPREFIP